MPLFDLATEFFPGMVEKSIKLLRQVQKILKKPYYGRFSGGKDSCVIMQLAKEAEVDVEWYYSNTTMDPPELLRFIRDKHPEVEIQHPKKNLVMRMVEKGVAPSRRIRWCCQEYKEGVSPRGSLLLLGVRSMESPRRKNSWLDLQFHHNSSSYSVCPILPWSDKMVWEFIRNRNIPYCSLYDEGFSRLGCIGCPLASCENRRKMFLRWPGYERLWRLGFTMMWEQHHGRIVRSGKEWFGSNVFSNAEEMWQWWITGDNVPSSSIKCNGLLDMYG